MLCDFSGLFLLKGKSRKSVWISSFFYNFNFAEGGETACSLGALPSLCMSGKKWTIIVEKWRVKEWWVDVSYPGTQFNSEDFVWIHVLFCHYWSWNGHKLTFTASIKEEIKKNFHGIWFQVTLELADCKGGQPVSIFFFPMLKWMKTNRLVDQYVWTTHIWTTWYKLDVISCLIITHCPEVTINN